MAREMSSQFEALAQRSSPGYAHGRMLEGIIHVIR